MNLQGKKIVVTGADGFIGSHLAEMLVRQGAHVRAMVQYNSMGLWGWLDQSVVAKDMEIIPGDIRDAQLCRTLIKGADSVFHLAALIGIPYSYQAVQSYVDTNITGTVNVCTAALEAECERVLVTSTSEVYGSALQVPISESHPLQPQSPYSATKIGADAIAMSFFYSFGLPLVIARPFNTYGPRQSARAVIPSIIIQLANGKEVISLGDVSTSRDFNFVTDTCQGMIALMTAEATGTANHIIGKAINIGSNSEVTIRDLFGVVCELMGSRAQLKLDATRQRPVASEVNRLWCDNSQLSELTHFIPEHNLRSGLAQTIHWFSQKENLSKYKAELYHV